MLDIIIIILCVIGILLSLIGFALVYYNEKIIDLRKKENTLLIHIFDFLNDDEEDEFTRFCFDCDYEFPKTENELIYKFCPFCGKETYGFDDESFERFNKNYGDLDKERGDLDE